MELKELRKRLVIATNGESTTFYEVFCDDEDYMKYLISEITIKNGKKGNSWEDIVLPGYVEANPDINRILTLSGVAHTKTEVVNSGLNKGLCRREFHSSYYDVLSLKLIGLLQSPSRLKSIFLHKDSEFYESITSSITKRKLDTFPTEELDIRLKPFFPGENWFNVRSLSNKLKEESQISTPEELAELDKIRDVEEFTKKSQDKHKAKIFVVPKLGI